MNQYKLLVLHKMDESFGYYNVETGEMETLIKTRPYPHEICLSPDRKKVYVAEMGVRGIESEGPGGHTIAVFDAASRTQISTIDTGTYDRPHGIASHGNGKLFITSESTKNLLIYDITEEKLEHVVYLDQECAHMVTPSPDGKFAYTANIGSNSLTVVDTEKGAVVRHISVLERPEAMVFTQDGSLVYVVNRESKAVSVVDTAKGEMIDTIETGHGPVRLVLSPDEKTLGIPLFHSDAIQIADTETRKVTHTISVGKQPAGTAMSPDGALIFMSCEVENMVYVFSMKSLSIVNKIKTREGADAMVCMTSSELEG